MGINKLFLNKFWIILRMPLANVKPFYLKFGNDEIKCTYIKKDKLPSKK